MTSLQKYFVDSSDSTDEFLFAEEFTFFIAIKLTSENPTHEWNCEKLDDAVSANSEEMDTGEPEEELKDKKCPRPVHSLLLKRAIMDPEANPDELHMIEIRTRDMKGYKPQVPLAYLKYGSIFQSELNLMLSDFAVELKLVKGSGPVYILGQHVVSVPQPTFIAKDGDSTFEEDDDNYLLAESFIEDDDDDDEESASTTLPAPDPDIDHEPEVVPIVAKVTEQVAPPLGVALEHKPEMFPHVAIVIHEPEVVPPVAVNEHEPEMVQPVAVIEQEPEVVPPVAVVVVEPEVAPLVAVAVAEEDLNKKIKEEKEEPIANGGVDTCNTNGHLKEAASTTLTDVEKEPKVAPIVAVAVAEENLNKKIEEEEETTTVDTCKTNGHLKEAESTTVTDVKQEPEIVSPVAVVEEELNKKRKLEEETTANGGVDTCNTNGHLKEAASTTLTDVKQEPEDVSPVVEEELTKKRKLEEEPATNGDMNTCNTNGEMKRAKMVDI